MATDREQRRLVQLETRYRTGVSWYEATIHNVSSRGLMLKCAEPPPKGAPVDVRRNGIVIAGEVAWSLGERFGIHSFAPIDFAALQEDADDDDVGRRIFPRVPVRIAAELELGDATCTVQLTDISQAGARVKMPRPPPAGRAGLLCWGGNKRSCTVRWSSGNAIGVTFDERLPNREVISARSAGKFRGAVFGGPVWGGPEVPARLLATARTERRQSRRANLRLDCDIRQGDGPWLRTCLEDVSLEGFRLAWFAGCQINEGLSLRLPDGTLVEAEIQRRDDRMIACSFVAGLDREVLDRVSVR